MATLTWLGHAAFRLETDRGKHVYVDPFLTGNPKTPEDERTPERVDVIAVTHGHGDHVGDTVELSQRFPDAEIVCQVELKKWLGRAGRERRRRAGPQQGRHAARRRHLLHAHRRAALLLGRRDRRVPRRGLRVRDHARGRGADLLRRRHVRVRRHAADPAPLRAAARRAADRRPLHDGAARGRDRARHARPPRCVPCHWGTFPLLTGTPAALAALAEGSIVEEIEPGDTVEV